jgi:phosphoribosylformylglycinamidine synthase I
MRPPILILHAPGTNRDREAAWACEQAGGAPVIALVDDVVSGAVRLGDHAMLLLPGGFSYGDDLGAGKLWATALREGLGDQLAAFVAAGRPVLGICNGFQALVKAGLLPGDEPSDAVQRVTLTRNDSARFECRWVWLRADPSSPCVFTRELGDQLVHCPIAHGEGKVVARDDLVREAIGTHNLAALRYVRPDGSAADYPFNPNGSEGDIAGLTNPAGNVLGLMPHPEDHIIPTQHPRFHRGGGGGLGIALFNAGVRYAAQVG